MLSYEDVYEAIAYSATGPAISRKTVRRLLDRIAELHLEVERYKLAQQS